MVGWRDTILESENGILCLRSKHKKNLENDLTLRQLAVVMHGHNKKMVCAAPCSGKTYLAMRYAAFKLFNTQSAEIARSVKSDVTRCIFILKASDFEDPKPWRTLYDALGLKTVPSNSSRVVRLKNNTHIYFFSHETPIAEIEKKLDGDYKTLLIVDDAYLYDTDKFEKLTNHPKISEQLILTENCYLNFKYWSDLGATPNWAEFHWGIKSNGKACVVSYGKRMDAYQKKMNCKSDSEEMLIKFHLYGD